MTDIDHSKNVYLFIHGRVDLAEKSIDLLTSSGFSKEKIIMADPKKAGDVDDYMAMLWMPPNPDHIKIQKITKVEASDDSGMIGVWNGGSKDDVSAACNDYLKVLGLVATAHAWIKVLEVSFKDYENNKQFYEEKIQTANFFFNRVLPRIESYYLTATTGSKYIMDFKFN